MLEAYIDQILGKVCGRVPVVLAPGSSGRPLGRVQLPWASLHNIARLIVRVVSPPPQQGFSVALAPILELTL